MDHTAFILETAHQIYARANETDATDADKESRPPAYKAIGIGLAVGSGLFIGTSFVLKKVGLLRANEKYQQAAGEGYGYLKNALWWSGMSLMILGEILNFVAYAFTDAILVTSLGAISVVIATVLSAIFLKERLSLIGKVACFLCVVGAVIIVLNAPTESSVANIQEMQHYVISPGFLSYAGVIVVGAIFLAVWAGPRYGKKNMFTYISICSWVGALSVVATQGLGAAIVAQIGGEPQFNHWFLYVLFVFIIGTLVTEIIYLNKALNIFNAAMVTPTYYVYFTSTTIITSAVLFRGFKGTAVQIITVVFGFLVICSGVVLLQLSKSAKDVPDTAVFAGDLDQIQTIAEQEQPETEPKADALRGTAAILRRISNARTKMEHEEFKRLHHEKEMERLATLSEDGQPEQFEWDGLRRRRTTMGSNRSRPFTSPSPAQTPHPPLGRTRLLSDDELEELERERQMSPGVLSSIAGTIRQRARSVLHNRPELPHQERLNNSASALGQTHPVQLTHIAVPEQSYDGEAGPLGYGLRTDSYHTEYSGAGDFSSKNSDRHIQFSETPKPGASMTSLVPPTPPPHGEQPHAARRQFSFQNVFRRHQADRVQEPALPSMHEHSLRQGLRSRGYSDRSARVKNATEEERLGLVTGDSQSMPALPRYDGDLDDDDDLSPDEKHTARYDRGITSSPPGSRSDDGDDKMYDEYDEDSRREWNTSRHPSRSRDASSRHSTPPLPQNPPSYRRGGGGDDDAFL
ncbi:magnesium transporter NIPA-domain-containing protein [Xylaria bambusicola]|uniref:magnesium transporter NIPA-domain-containing protein n=1 Tax=Xylaria bambusicola TaxID=326684 RepID=UPI002008E6C1|nr:magnesium transporter NIPA-domain-containing protein [Xylaria bambusicola]KAI0521425.1 magnesium transporter NIPA-domain-containing protein [Xylaria bambusicola]